jgi:hypothetical protein
MGIEIMPNVRNPFQLAATGTSGNAPLGEFLRRAGIDSHYGSPVFHRGKDEQKEKVPSPFSSPRHSLSWL